MTKMKLKVGELQLEALHEADVIYGHDPNLEHPILFYGRAALEQVVASGTSKDLRMMMLEIDSESDDLELVIAAVLTVKGYCDYRDPAD